MKRTDLKKHAAALLLVLCLLVTSALPALATSANIKLVDSSGNPTTGTIRVTLYDSANDKALSGGKLTLYRVAEVKTPKRQPELRILRRFLRLRHCAG